MSSHSDVVRLKSAILCVNCEVISNSNARCEICGSSAVLTLSRVLGGSITEQTSWKQSEVQEANSLLDELYLSVDPSFSCSRGQTLWTI